MNTSRLIWGIICLALAGLLALANVSLPAENLMFMVAGRNRPWVPPVILGVLGIVLVASAGGGAQKTRRPAEPGMVDERKVALNKRLETIGWGSFLIMLGGFALVPEDIVAKGFWSIGVGVIMLGLNAARYASDIRMSGFTTFLGLVSLISGVLQVLGTHNLEGPILLIVLGAYLVLRPWFEEQQLFGKAEES